MDDLSGEDMIPLSLISQYGYCARRAGLILLGRGWQDNTYTASGTAAHLRVHTSGHVTRGELVKLYDYCVASRRLGLSGRCDCLEAVCVGEGGDGEGADGDGAAALPGYEGRFRLRPVEFKHGVTRDEGEYNLQLCAQAMCLEEAYGASVPEGDIFYTESRRRFAVRFTPELRAKTGETAAALHAMLETLELPRAAYSPRCEKCSMIDLCEPKLRTDTAGYLKGLFDEEGK